MKFVPTALPGVIVGEPEPHCDERGFFARVYCPAEFAKAGIDFAPTQVNLSRNIHRHTLRGLHYQDAPNAEAKLIRVTKGRIFEVVVDLRNGTPTHLCWISLELDATSAKAIFVPEGCAHGFMTLEPDTDILYQMGRDYVPGLARGLRWNDTRLGIIWPTLPTQISSQDHDWPLIS
ncbi:MAG: dTDP-4-dehydrorhamnose 3,5-epimerase family protein [Bosea sp. (in: a-proteobacteria)]